MGPDDREQEWCCYKGGDGDCEALCLKRGEALKRNRNEEQTGSVDCQHGREHSHERPKEGKRRTDLNQLVIRSEDEVKEGKKQAQRQADLDSEALRRQTAGG